MKHFIIEITYTSELSKIEEVLQDHRNFLQSGYDNGMLLCSGPMNPRTGGILIARAENDLAIKEFLIHDPYNVNELVEYRIVEFNPVKSQNFMENWIKG
jgi:uncharacterized protein YciI